MAARPGKDRRSRAELFQAEMERGGDRDEMILPFVEPSLSHVIDHLFDVGPAEKGEVLSFQELTAWMALSGVSLTPWEASTIRMLSSVYLTELDRAGEPNRPSPVRVIRHANAKVAMDFVRAMMAQYDEAPEGDPAPEVAESPKPVAAGPASRQRSTRSPGGRSST